MAGNFIDSSFSSCFLWFNPYFGSSEGAAQVQQPAGAAPSQAPEQQKLLNVLMSRASSGNTMMRFLIISKV
jgi:hypothetical protein|tara:strand:+ start:3189 stop:3401 length:213 start_codon:yes stop_codon:yes gene_type:complete